MSIEKTIAENTAAVLKLTETLLALNLQPIAAQPESDAAKKPDAQKDTTARTPRTAAAGDASDKTGASSDSDAPPAGDAQTAGEPAAQTTPDAESEPVTYEQASAAVTGLAKTKGRAVAIDVLKKFGATKLPEVKPEQFAALIKACAEA